MSVDIENTCFVSVIEWVDKNCLTPTDCLLLQKCLYSLFCVSVLTNFETGYVKDYVLYSIPGSASSNLLCLKPHSIISLKI